MEFKKMPWYFKILGFYYIYKMQILTNPTSTEEGEWTYEVKLIGYELKWLGFKLKYYDIPQD